MLIRLLVKCLGGFWRLREKAQTSKVRIFRSLYGNLYTFYLQTFGSWIPVGTTFGGPPVFPHGPYGIFMSGAARIGKNCVIFQHVMIGSNSLIDSQRIGAPTLGDNCYLGVGAKIIGNIKVGNNVRVAANTCVYQDVPDNSVVLSGAQKVITRVEPQNNKFYHRYNGQWRYYDDGRWTDVTNTQELALLNQKFS